MSQADALGSAPHTIPDVRDISLDDEWCMQSPSVKPVKDHSLCGCAYMNTDFLIEVAGSFVSSGFLLVLPIRPIYRLLPPLCSGQSLPVTSLRFRPAGTQGKTRNVLVSCNAAGEIQHWHITSGMYQPNPADTFAYSLAGNTLFTRWGRESDKAILFDSSQP